MNLVKAQIIKKNGKKAFAILSYSEFLRLQQRLQDYEDLRCLREAKRMEKDAPTLGLPEVKRRLQTRAKRPSRRRRPQGLVG